MGTQTGHVVGELSHIVISGHAYLECLRKAHATAGGGGLQEGKATRNPFRTLVECFASRSERLMTTRYGDGSDRLRNGAARFGDFSMYLGSTSEWMRRPAEVVGSVVSSSCERSDES